MLTSRYNQVGKKLRLFPHVEVLREASVLCMMVCIFLLEGIFDTRKVVAVRCPAVLETLLRF